MTTTLWVGNGQQIQQVESLTVTAVALGGTLDAILNGKTITYTCTGADTTSTAATAWATLLSDAGAPAEFGEITWEATAAVILATAKVPGTPFAGMTGGLTSAGAGGATVSQASVTANSSQSDVNNPANWLRGGSPGIPQNTDDVVLADSSVPLLWNLDALAAVQFNSFTRWQSFTATIGLPVQNPLGYLEFRPTYFQFVGAGVGFTMILGQGTTGGGPSRERYNVGAQQTKLVILTSGSAADAYAVCFLGSNASNVVSMQNATLGVAMTPGETATIASAQADGGGLIAMGAGVTFSGNLVLINASAVVNCAPALVDAQAGSQVVVGSLGLTHASVKGANGANITWLSNSTVTALTMVTSSVFDKSQDLRGMVITSSTIDGTCQINDPGNAITYTNPTTLTSNIVSGPFIIGSGRTVKVV